jgi:hypothetical protein
MMAFIQKRSTVVLIISVFFMTRTDIIAQTLNSKKNEPEHIIHPKIKLPDLQEKSKPKSSKILKSSFQTIKWLDLMPSKDLNSLENPPDYLMNTDEGTDEDEIPDELRNLPQSIKDDYQRALTSMDVIPEMNNKAIRIPGFVVPVEFNEQQKITQFFLVPYFGACIHLPPPPPNQIIFVTSKTGIGIQELLDPVWISGVLQTSHFENNVAISAYSMQMKSFKMYED